MITTSLLETKPSFHPAQLNAQHRELYSSCPPAGGDQRHLTGTFQRAAGGNKHNGSKFGWKGCRSSEERMKGSPAERGGGGRNDGALMTTYLAGCCSEIMW